MNNKKKVFWGILLIVIGILIVGDKLDLIGDISILKLIFSIIMGFMAIKSLLKLEFFGFFFPLAFVGIIYADELKILAITPWTILFVAFLFATGLSLIFRRKKMQFNMKFSSDEIIDYEDENLIKLDVLFTESIKYLSNKKFKLLDLDCNFSGAKLYFQDVAMENGRGLVNMDCNFSGVELYIPKEWRLEINLNTFFSGIKENGFQNIDGENILVLEGDLNFSSLDIYYI